MLLAGRQKIVVIEIMTASWKNEIRPIAQRVHIGGHHYLDERVDDSRIINGHKRLWQI